MNSNMKSVLRNYIQNCGEGRNLSKFLRRNSYSSDERDIASPITTETCRSKHKSLENLNEAAKKEEHIRKSPLKDTESNKSKDPEPIKPMEGTKVVVKQTGEKVDKKKTFNYESVIEITLPPQQQSNYPALPHTMPELSKDISFGEEKTEEPIKPIICTPKSAKIPPHNNNKNKKISPSSGNDEESFVSNKQNPMEWDDFIPGYETEISQLEENPNMQLCNNNPMELNDNELNALKTYFHQRGLQLPNENLIVVIKNRHEKVSEGERALEHIRRNKEKWQNIYEKYKEKYQPQQQTTINFEDIEAQSTPKIPEMSSGASKISAVTEKGSQTSLIRSSAKSVQVESSSINRNQYKSASKDVATIESKTEDYEVYQNHSEIAESFEFVHGPKRKESVSSKESSRSKKSTSMATEAGSSKISVLSESLKNEDIANFDDSLKVAIALLNSLLDSNMRPELKRNLAEKVIQKITQIQTSKSIQTSTIDSTNSSKSHSDKKSAKEKSARREEALKECLAPMTKSEYSHQNSQSSNKESFGINSIPKSQLMNFVKREKQSQLKWIEKEIEHLNNLRDLLKRNETSLSENCPIYENLSSIKTKEKSLRSEPEKKAATDTNFWNSHANMKKIKNRSKMELPNSDLNLSRAESLSSFIDSRSKRFLEKYSQHQKKLEENDYTQPKSNVSKDPQVKSKSTRKTQMTANKDVQTSTSLASSSVFESSDLTNVPSSSANTNTKSTTHYQTSKAVSSREHKQKVAVTQTTDSICRTRPIYEVRDKDDEKFGTTSTTVTKRVQKLQNDKQLQTQPPSIKYTLTFDKKSKPKMRPYSSLPQKMSNDYGTISKSSKDIYNQISYSASLNYHYEENKENYDNDILFDDADEDVDLQKCFKKRPNIYSRFEQRKKCIEELRKLR
ncbi:hypothetical protein ACKWTF_007212 [Chironomus riparius]